MIKIFSTLFLAIFISLASFAKDVKFDFANNEFNLPTTSNTSDATKYLTEPIVKDGIVITMVKGASKLGPLMYFSSYNNTLDLRFYVDSGFEITSMSGEAITSISFISNGKFNVTPDSGDWTGDTGETWTGSASRVSFSVNGSTQLYEIIVTTDAGTVTCAAPTFTPTFVDCYEDVEVSILCATAGATIYYTTNGDIPTKESQVYTAPITINKETVFKAIGAIEDAVSTVAEAQYLFPEFVNAANIAEFVSLSNSALPIRIGGDVVVAYQNAKYLFVKDDSGYTQVYGDLGKFYAKGDVIPAGIVGDWTNYAGTPQLSPIAHTFKGATATAVVNPIEVSVADFNDNLVNSYVIGKNWNLHVTKSGNNYSYKVSDASGVMLDVYMRFKGVVAPIADGVYDIVGIANKFNEVYQIFPIEFNEASGVTDAISSTASITSTVGEIVVKAETPGTVTIFNAAGSVAKSATIGEGENRISIASGFYIVKIDNLIEKVIVK